MYTPLTIRLEPQCMEKQSPILQEPPARSIPMCNYPGSNQHRKENQAALSRPERNPWPAFRSMLNQIQPEERNHSLFLHTKNRPDTKSLIRRTTSKHKARNRLRWLRWLLSS
jgi:hypothetical protein